MTTDTMLGDAPNTTAAAPATDATTTAAPAPAAAASPPASPATADATKQADPAGAKPDDAASTKPVERAAPEKYEFKLPEAVKLDPSILGEFESTARELKMPQDEAQKLVEKLAPKIQERVAQQLAETVERQSTEWSEAARADKEYGGDKLTENLALGEKALATFGTPALREMLIDSKLGNHPEVIRFMVRAGKALSADNKFVDGKQLPAEKSAAAQLYPTMKQ